MLGNLRGTRGKGDTEVTLPPTSPWASDGLGCGDNGCWGQRACGQCAESWVAGSLGNSGGAGSGLGGPSRCPRGGARCRWGGSESRAASSGMTWIHLDSKRSDGWISVWVKYAKFCYLWKSVPPKSVPPKSVPPKYTSDTFEKLFWCFPGHERAFVIFSDCFCCSNLKKDKEPECRPSTLYWWTLSLQISPAAVTTVVVVFLSLCHRVFPWALCGCLCWLLAPPRSI